MSRSRGFALLCLVLFLVLSRPPFWTAHPPNFDFANFALGVARFALLDHQPQPPGYPLVILMAKALAACGLPIVRALYVTALLGGIAAIFGAYVLGKQLSGDLGGMLASVLLAIEPVFWYSGVSSPTRIYLATGVCWLLWCLTGLSRGRTGLLWTAAGLLALFAGFRPELAPFFFAPFLIAARLAGIPWRKIALAGFVCLAACLPWLIWITASYGSTYRFLYTYYHYFRHHASTTSALLGAPAEAWQGMLRQSLLWNALPGAVALVAVLISKKREGLDRRFVVLAGAYFIPALFIQLALHAGGPDHSLGTITVLCVAAGALLGTSRVFWPVALAAAAMPAISFLPLGTFVRDLDLLSLRSFARTQRSLAEMIQGLKDGLRPRDAIIVLNDSPLPGRILESELPALVIIALDSAIDPDAAAPPTGWRFFDRHQTALAGGHILLPSVDRLQILCSPAGTQRKWIRERLCARSKCEEDGARLQIEIGAQEALSLPPYTLRTNVILEKPSSGVGGSRRSARRRMASSGTWRRRARLRSRQTSSGTSKKIASTSQPNSRAIRM